MEIQRYKRVDSADVVSSLRPQSCADSEPTYVYSCCHLNETKCDTQYVQYVLFLRGSPSPPAARPQKFLCAISDSYDPSLRDLSWCGV